MSTQGEAPDAIWHEYWKRTPDSPYLTAEAGVVAESLVTRYALNGDHVVLDFGCGYGYVSEHLARTVSRVFIWDAVEEAMQRALKRIDDPAVAPIDPASTDQVFDLIVVNSVVQYMSEETLSWWLERWADLLATGAAIAITDVPASSPSLVLEGAQWLWLALRKGVLVDAVRFARANSARYQKARAKTGLGAINEADLNEMAERAGLDLEREPRNLAYQRGRASYTLRSRS